MSRQGEVKADQALVKSQCPQGPTACPNLKVDVLKVPHHGSADFDRVLFTATDPTGAIVSAGFRTQDSHRLPREDVLTALAKDGVHVLSMSADGPEPIQLTIHTDGTLSWDVPPNPAFFWRKDAGEYFEVEVDQAP